MVKKASTCIFLILVLVFSYNMFPETKNPNPVSALSEIQPISSKKIQVPKEYENGRFMHEGDLLAFQAPDVKLKFMPDVRLSKYIVCNKQGEIVKKYNRVISWDHGSLMLRLNAVNSLLLVNLKNNFQRIIDVDIERLRNISVNPFNKTVIYTYVYGNKVYEYSILHRRSRCLVELMHGNLMVLFQISPHELVYMSPKVSISYMNQYDTDPSVSVEVPVYLANLKRERWGVLTKMSRCGLLVHYNEEDQNIIFVVEENGYLKFISSKSIGAQKKLKVSHLNHNTRDTYEGILLTHSAMNSQGNLLATSRIKVKKKKLTDPDDFEFIAVDPENYIPKSGDIYILDMKGNYKKLTNTPEQIEVLNDWSEKEDEILYYDFKSKTFYIMGLKLSGKYRKKPFKTTPDKVKKIMP